MGEISLPIAALFEDFVETAQAVPEPLEALLYPEERACIARAIAKRRAEFATGRVCARQALERLGVRPGPLLPHADRSPIWPAGIVGSISHTDGYCAVAVARTSRARGLGLDAERDSDLAADLEAVVCTSRERHWLDGQPAFERGFLGKLLFGAKEAFYKCQYPLTRSFLEFREVCLEIDVLARTFAVRHIERAGRQWARLYGARGRFVRESGFIVTAASLLTHLQE